MDEPRIDFTAVENAVTYFDEHPPDWTGTHMARYGTALRTLVEYARESLRLTQAQDYRAAREKDGPDQYDLRAEKGSRPDHVVDPHGDVWVWTDADARGRPGYRWTTNGTGGIGPAHTLDYVRQGRQCIHFASGQCPVHDHTASAVESWP